MQRIRVDQGGNLCDDLAVIKLHVVYLLFALASCWPSII